MSARTRYLLVAAAVTALTAGVCRAVANVRWWGDKERRQQARDGAYEVLVEAGVR